MKVLANRFSIAVAAVALAVVAVIAFMWAGPGVDALRGSASAAPPLYDEDTLVSIYERASPAVVEVDSLDRAYATSSLVPSGLGSGFLIDSEGYIVTNNHVVDGADQVRVTLSKDKSVTATVVGRSTAQDLALLKVNAADVAGIQPLTLGDSSILKPGQMAIALGNPYGLTDTITVGVISGLDRSLSSTLQRPISGVIQTDAAINPGNSGGPLLNSRGEVIGINTAIESSTTGGNKGIGFAVPVNTLKDLLASLKQGGVLRPAFLGITGLAVTADLKSQLNLAVDKGVYVVGVTEGGPADKAGIVAAGYDRRKPTTGGDVITAIDGVSVASVEDIANYLNGKKPGDSVALTVVRGSDTITVNVTLGQWPDTPQRLRQGGNNKPDDTPSLPWPRGRFPWRQLP